MEANPPNSGSGPRRDDEPIPGMGHESTRAILARALQPEGNLAEAMAALAGRVLTDPEDAESLAHAIQALAMQAPRDLGTLHAALGLMQGIDSLEAYQVLEARALPPLVQVFDTELTALPSRSPEARAQIHGFLLFLLKVKGLYQSPFVTPRIATAARTPGWDHHPLWPVLFRTFDPPHPRRRELAEALRDPLPEGLAGAAYLDFANEMARTGELVFHPFDSPAGKARLRAWLGRTGPEHLDLATAAAAALVHVGGPERPDLLQLGLDHPFPRVQLEAARAAARLGREEGLQRLVELCLDVRHSMAARLNLQELGRADLVPAAAHQPDFEAMAGMVDWLAHPLEFGRPPDQIRQLDTRELLWPPANDLRRVWLFEYRYAAGPHDGVEVLGVGMVGSITFSLHNETSPAMDPEDIYALHCCWELQVDSDPRAPSQRTVTEGRRLLGLKPKPGA